jgi:hypothetical protein
MCSYLDSILYGSHILKKIPTYYGTGTFRAITVTTRACHVSRSWSRSIQSTASQHLKMPWKDREILKLLSHHNSACRDNSASRSHIRCGVLLKWNHYIQFVWAAWCVAQMKPLHTICVGRDNSVDIETRYGLDGLGIESWWGWDFPHPSRPVLGPTQPPVQRLQGFFPGVKADGARRWPPTPN